MVASNKANVSFIELNVSGSSLVFYFLLFFSNSVKINSYESCINLSPYYQDEVGFFTFFYRNENGNISLLIKWIRSLDCRTRVVSLNVTLFYFYKHWNWFGHANGTFLKSCCQLKSYRGAR